MGENSNFIVNKFTGNKAPMKQGREQSTLQEFGIRYHCRDNLARVRANTLTPFDISWGEENSSGLWLYPAKAVAWKLTQIFSMAQAQLIIRLGASVLCYLLEDTE